MMISGRKRRASNDACRSYIMGRYMLTITKFKYPYSCFGYNITKVCGVRFLERTKMMFKDIQEFTGTYIARKF